eukprot:g9640.t1
MDLVMPVQPDMYPGCFAVPMDRFGRFPAPEGGLPDFTPLGVTTTADNKRAQVLQRTFSLATNIYRIRWTLKSTDKEAVSPQFEISFSGGNVPFKMIMRPRAVAQERGGASFKRSRGRGNLQLRCMARLWLRGMDPRLVVGILHPHLHHHALVLSHFRYDEVASILNTINLESPANAPQIIAQFNAEDMERLNRVLHRQSFSSLISLLCKYYPASTFTAELNRELDSLRESVKHKINL